MKNRIAITFILNIYFVFLINFSNSFGQEDNLTVFKKVDRGRRSLYMELLINNPNKNKIEKAIESLVQKYGDRKWLQIDIFDNLEALQRRDDEKYSSKLINKHWLVSITKEKIYRFYLKERSDIQ